MVRISRIHSKYGKNSVFEHFLRSAGFNYLVPRKLHEAAK